MDTPDLRRNHRFQFLDQIVSHAVQEQLLVLDANLAVQAASKTFYTLFQVARSETIGRRLAELGNGQWKITPLLTLLNNLAQDHGEFDNFEMEHDFPALGNRAMLVSARRLLAADDQAGLVLLSIRDITGQRLVEAECSLLVTRYRA